jgi:hypothetical protein
MEVLFSIERGRDFGHTSADEWPNQFTADMIERRRSKSRIRRTLARL